MLWTMTDHAKLTDFQIYNKCSRKRQVTNDHYGYRAGKALHLTPWSRHYYSSWVDSCIWAIGSGIELRDNVVIVTLLQPYVRVFCSYVSAMVPVKTMKEYDMAQEVTVLFSETVQRSVKKFWYAIFLFCSLLMWSIYYLTSTVLPASKIHPKVISVKEPS